MKNISRYEINRAIKKPKKYDAGEYEQARKFKRFMCRCFYNDSLNRAALNAAVYGDKERYNELYEKHSK